jgi:2-polyprenyl-3-methyl-5-hydroxy-6-metoxy-1,4-benzoquinol methylase
MADTQALREALKEMKDSVIAFGALAAALVSADGGSRCSAGVEGEIEGVVRALGLRDAISLATPAERGAMLGEIRAALLQASGLACAAQFSPGWTHTDPQMLQSQGDASATIPSLLQLRIAPRLAGLDETLRSSSASFLDVGVGVACLSIAMARQWPSLRVVGIDLWRPALELARANVATADLVSRIELREQAVQELEDCDRFDLAWLPGMFIDAATIDTALGRVRRALRPGGWLLFGILNPPPDERGQRIARLRTVLWGGEPRTPRDVKRLLSSANYTEVQAAPAPPWAPGTLVVGRKPV